MTEFSLPWGGTLVGDAGPYTDADWSDMFRKLFTRDRTTEGVLQDYANQLEVTNPAGTTIRVATGAAIVDGKFYETTAVVDFSVVAPGSGSNYYTVILRKSWTGAAAQTVRAVMLGPNIVAPPAVTQTDGVIWEISIATVQITSGGVITVTDTRVFRVSSSTFPLAARQGQLNTYWWGDGSNDVIPPDGDFIMQIGVTEVTVGVGDETGFASVTFPIPFINSPFVTGHVQRQVDALASDVLSPCPTFIITGGGTGMTVYATRKNHGSTGSGTTVNVFWIAMGVRES